MPAEELIRRLRARLGGLLLLAALLLGGGAAVVLSLPRAYLAEAVVAPSETTGIATSALLSAAPGAGLLPDGRPAGNFAIYLGALRSAGAAEMLAAQTTLLQDLTARRADGAGGWLRRALGLRIAADLDDLRTWLERSLSVTQALGGVTWTLAIAASRPGRRARRRCAGLHAFAEDKVRADLGATARRRIAALEARLAREPDLYIRQSLYELLAQQQRAGVVVAADEAVAARLVQAPVVEIRPSLPNRPLLLLLLLVAAPLAACAVMAGGRAATRRAAPAAAGGGGVSAAASLAGISAAVLQLAGALKTAPPLSALPFDLTLVALALLLPSVTMLAATRSWRVSPAVALPAASALLLALWLVVAGAWSPSRAVLAHKLPEVALLGPVLLAAGLLVGAEAAARRAFCRTTLAIGLALAAAILLGRRDRLAALGPGGCRDGQDPPPAGGPRPCHGGGARGHAGGGGALRERRAAAAGGGRAPRARRAVPRRADGDGRAVPRHRGGARALPPAFRPAWRGAGLERPGRVRCRHRHGAAPAAPGPRGGAAHPGAAGRRSRGARGAAAPLGRGPGLGGRGLALRPRHRRLHHRAGFGERRGLYPHNHALETLAEAGLPGLLLWIGAYAGAAVAMLRLAPRVAPGRAARIAALVLPVGLTVMVSTDPRQPHGLVRPRPRAQPRRRGAAAGAGARSRPCIAASASAPWILRRRCCCWRCSRR
jgi:hypothetical protein